MILLLSLWLHPLAWSENMVSCAEARTAKFKSIELKLNMDADPKPDVVAVFAMGSGEGPNACERRALIFNAPEKLTDVTPTEHWLGPVDFADPDSRVSRLEVQKRSLAGGRDLLLLIEEVGGFQSHTYFSGEGAKLTKALAFGHPDADGQFNENYDSKTKKLGLRIFDGGTLEVNGKSVDLDQRAIKLRCRVRELHVQMKYDWDGKDRLFKETEEGCVMGNAID